VACCHEREIIVTENAPQAIGPYSVGVKANHFVFTAGQIGLDPKTQAIVDGGVEAETKQALTNVKAILEAAGTSLDQVVKTTVFLRDMNDFSRMNAVYATFFSQNPPARSAVQAAGLPKGVAVEIEAVAVVPCDKHHGDGHD
jgi:2-iminobutanoate/2-iminopropanoate deaminase